MDGGKTDDSIRLFKFVVSFVYEELIEQFITHKGECKNFEQTFCLVNWGFVLDSSQASSKNKNKILNL
jgi:hypothetical protein